MTIITPSLQYNLLYTLNPPHPRESTQFYLRYLRIASRNINRNFENVITAKQFKEDLHTYIKDFNKYFNWKLREEDFNNSKNTDFYMYLYNKIAKNTQINNKKLNSVPGSYFKLIDNRIETRYFRPSLLHSNSYWILTDASIAILVNCYEIALELPLIFLEIDLLKAAGFTLVLCSSSKESIFKFIDRNQFAEIHISFFNSILNPFYSFLSESEELSHSHFKKNKGFVYLYAQYDILLTFDKYESILSKIKTMERLLIFQFSKKKTVPS